MVEPVPKLKGRAPPLKTPSFLKKMVSSFAPRIPYFARGEEQKQIFMRVLERV